MQWCFSGAVRSVDVVCKVLPLLEDLAKEFSVFFGIRFDELKDCSPVQYWLDLATKEGFGDLVEFDIVDDPVESKCGEKRSDVEDHDASKNKNHEWGFVLVALTDLLDRSVGVAVKAGHGGVGCLKGADGRIGDRRFGPFGLAPGGRMGKRKN